MAREKKQEEAPAGCPLWMASYGDLVTLLLTFFVLLYAMSIVDQKKFDQVAASLAQSFGGVIDLGGGASSGVSEFSGDTILAMNSAQAGSDENYEAAQEELKEMVSDFETYFAENNLQEQIKIEKMEEFVRLTFPDGILFDVGKANLRQNVLPTLRLVAEELLKYPDSDVKIEGHTDSDPISTIIYPSNWYLSGARAIAVGEFFIDESGLSPVRIAVEGRGEFLPVAPNDTPENKAKNRRVEIKIYSKYYSNTIN